ncbi:MAG: thioredoxin family protein [Pseudomonadota bacterium]
MNRRPNRAWLGGWLALLLCWPLLAGAATPPWWEPAADGSVRVHLYFFWSQSCPHCQEARPDVAAMAAELPWLQVHDLEVSRDRENAAFYTELAGALGQEARSVPAFLFCGSMVAGYDDAAGIGRFLREQLIRCHDSLRAGAGLPAPLVPGATELLAQAGLAGLGGSSSLPLVTLVIAGLDAFNPCAFFVLLFLLSLLVHAGGRRRMLLVGGVFVAISGLVYFALMAAWLNVFLVVGQLQIVTLLAGLLAVVMALINIKDYLRPGRGPSLSIPAAARPGIYQRVRGLLRADSLPALLAGTVILALAVNSYELLCTAGFPMLYTRLLTLHQLPASAYYAYLALYSLIYVVPLLVIVAVFSWTLGSRKLQPEEGALLKLLSGSMMLGLGLVLLLAPERLSDLRVAAGLLGAALGVTLLARWAERRRRSGGR